LYASKFDTGPAPTINLDGTIINSASFTPLGVNAGFLQAWRADVTSVVASKVGGGSAVPFVWSITETTETFPTDGEVLAIVYSNPTEQFRTIAFLDGFASSAGDITTVNFGGPVNTLAPGFEALLSLGIGFGFQPSNPSQFSTVDVSIGNRRLTSSAGGFDDGTGGNGGLITVGGIGDSTLNPDPNAAPANTFTDDELYNLALGNVANPAPFLPNGTSSFQLRTANPSADDLVFFVGINVTAQATVNNAVPEPATLLIWTLAGGGAAAFGWRRRKVAASL
jgi:hypothetical protein